MSARRGRRGAGAARGPPVSKAQLGMLKSSLHGHDNDLTATNPPQFNRKPFNSITVETILETPDEGTITFSDILAALKSQLNVPGNVTLNFKLKRVDLWAADDTETPYIRAAFYSLHDQGHETSASSVRTVPIKFLEDQGQSGQSMAVVSYTWPRAQQDLPFAQSINSQFQSVVKYTKNEHAKIYVRLHLLWNTGDIFPAPTAVLRSKK